EEGLPDPGGVPIRGRDLGTRPVGIICGPARYAGRPLFLERPLRRGNKRRGGGPGASKREAPYVLPARGLLGRGDGRRPGRWSAASGRGGLPAGGPGAAGAPRSFGDSLRRC